MSTDRQYVARSGVAICSALSTALLNDQPTANDTLDVTQASTLDVPEFNIILATISDSFIDFSFALQARNYSKAHQCWHNIRRVIESGHYALQQQFIKNLWQPMQAALEVGDEQQIHAEYKTLLSSYNRAYH